MNDPDIQMRKCQVLKFIFLAFKIVRNLLTSKNLLSLFFGVKNPIAFCLIHYEITQPLPFLSRCKASKGVLEELIGSCHYLQKLSTNRIVDSVFQQNGEILQTLELGRLILIDMKIIKLITR